jgi:superfamily II DNA or RNA helicase
MKKVDARYVYGVSATSKRGDGLGKIIYMLIGPVRHSYTAKERATEQGIGHYVYSRYTRVVDTDESKGDINGAYFLISSNAARNEVAEHFAVIDDELVWHGGMNLLGREDAWDNLMRVKSFQIAAELLEIALVKG